MDLHVIIVIVCVFLASLFSILFINKFFKNKTYEEAAAEKRAYVEKLYPKTQHQQKLRRKLQLPSKKELKKQQRKQNREQQSENDMPIDSDDGGGNSIESISAESSPSHVQTERKHSQVMFNEPEIIPEEPIVRKAAKKDGRKQLKPIAGSSSILRNKSEHGPIKDGLVAEPLNHFDVKRPKDVVELWKQNQINKNEDVKQSIKIEKKSNKQLKAATNDIDDLIIPKELKQLDEKASSSTANSRNDSPRIRIIKAKKMNSNTSSAGKDRSTILTKLDNGDVLSVQVLMALLNQSELNRNDIQILIDYLLNKQQDTPAVHSEWSDDIVQKLRKQLNDKEKQLQEEQGASIGIQAKLRELRTEINMERSQFNSTVKSYINEIELRKTDIQLLQQEIQNLNEKLQLERQQFQAKLQQNTKQATNHQELVQQIQKLTEHNNILQNENVQKTAYITEIQRMANASSLAITEHTKKLNEMNVVYQEQINKIRTLESKLSDSEQKLQCQQFEIEMSKKNESEKDSSKVEIRNLQNALETTRSELKSTINDLNDSKQNSDKILKQLLDLNDQINITQQHYDEKIKENLDLKQSIEQYKNLLNEKEIEIEKNLKQLTSRENDLLKELQEQKEKNNDLRVKNWKLVEALQNAESKKNSNINNSLVLTQQVATNNNEKLNGEKKVRELLERLYPDECKLLSGTALTLSFEQWFEQIISQHIKNESNLNLEKNHQINNINNNTKELSENNFNHHNHNNNNISNTIGSSSSSNSVNNNDKEASNNDQDLLLQNAKLKAQIKELTILATKTENVLTNLETKAREQDLHWRSIVQSKQDEINLLKNSNGEEILDLSIET